MSTATDRVGIVPAQVWKLLELLDVAEDLDDVDVRPLEGGASNVNYLVTSPRGRSVLRIAAPRSLSDRFALDRWNGVAAHRAAAQAGVAPALLAVALPAGHSVVEFIDGVVLDETTILEGRNLEDAVHALRSVHVQTNVECGRFSGLVEADRFIEIARREKLDLPDDIDDLHALCRQISEVFEQVNAPQLLCHNDVQLANLIRGNDSRLWVIDWEYAGRGNPYFDLAMLVNNADLTEPDIARVLTAYFGVARDADRARTEFERFDAALREALWSVVAEPVLDTGWDYRAWAERYFGLTRRIADRIRREGLLERGGPASDDHIIFERLLNND